MAGGRSAKEHGARSPASRESGTAGTAGTAPFARRTRVAEAPLQLPPGARHLRGSDPLADQGRQPCPSRQGVSVTAVLGLRGPPGDPSLVLRSLRPSLMQVRRKVLCSCSAGVAAVPDSHTLIQTEEPPAARHRPVLTALHARAHRHAHRHVEQTHTHAHTCMDTHAHTGTHAHTRTHRCTHTRACTCAHTHAPPRTRARTRPGAAALPLGGSV